MLIAQTGLHNVFHCRGCKYNSLCAIIQTEIIRHKRHWYILLEHVIFVSCEVQCFLALFYHDNYDMYIFS